MMISRGVGTGMALVLLLSCAAMPAWAERGDRDNDQREDARREKDRRQNAPKAVRQNEVQQGVRQKAVRQEVRRDDPRYQKKGYVYDNRYRHDRYYPPRGHVIQKLPPQHHVVPFRGTRYYYHDGVWYQPSRSRYVAVAPPIGLRISFLPSFYTTIWVGGLPYYYADDVYYAWYPEERVYVVTNPPPETEVSEQPATPDQLFVYPQKGQGEQQQATDRYQCHSWSVGQTGFDPTQPGGNVAVSSYDSNRSDYQRAMKACLEARGYSVQ
jgi:hypothetical protein